MEKAQTSQILTESPRTRRFFEAFPIIQSVAAGVIALAATWTTIQLTQNSQAAEIRRNTEEIERLKKESTPRELFDERTRTILENQKETKDLLNKLLERK